MTKFAPLMVAPPAIFAGLAVLFYVGMKRENPNDLPTAFQGKPAPAVILDQLGNEDLFDNNDLRQGGVKLVNYWASWCAPCRAEHPNLTALAETGIPIYGVNYKDSPPNALGFMQELGNPYSAGGADPSGKMALEWGVYGVPETYVIDAKGNIVLRLAGPMTQRVLNSQVMPAIEAAKAAAE